VFENAGALFWRIAEATVRDSSGRVALHALRAMAGWRHVLERSSVLKMLEHAFETDDKILCLWFNGWKFEGFEDAKAVVIETIVDELRRAGPMSTKVADAAKKVLKRVDWLKLARKAGGFAFTAATGIPTFDQVKACMTSPRRSLLSRRITFRKRI
jgi:KAP family P-loop domain